jgi:hypothetical protein
VNFSTATIFDLIRLAALQSPGDAAFCLLIAAQDYQALIPELQQEFAAETGNTPALIDAAQLSPEGLVQQLGSEQSRAVVLVYGLESWTDEQFRSLDINRSRLEMGQFLILKIDSENAGRFLSSAPNLRSYFASNIFVAEPDASNITAEAIQGRLSQLRSFYRMTDDELISKLSQQELTLDPEIIEWLVLIGRTDLI